uniref:Astacin domain-containing protein n=1 Tax=Strongyloides papillosus TaxID=174720 RepID=A0A0N5BVH0_STREA
MNLQFHLLFIIIIHIILISSVESSKRYKENIEKLRGLINGAKSFTNILKESRPEKTKRYKCVEIIDDEEEVNFEQLPIPNIKINNDNSFPIIDETSQNKFTTFNENTPDIEEIKYVTLPHQTTESVEFILTTMKPIPTTSTEKPSIDISDVPRDSKNRPLLLAPEHCKMIKKYADMYMVTNIRQWAHNHCSFAKMYLPTATCGEIDILVDSCFKQKFINE